MANSYRVGGDVDAQCNKCKMELGHTILAMVGSSIARVRCNTCNGEHVYRGGDGAAKRRSIGLGAKPGEKIKHPPRSVTSVEALLAGRDTSRARRYSPRDRLSVDDVLTHPSFGVGIVTAVRGEKAEVAFHSGMRTLIHSRNADATGT